MKFLIKEADMAMIRTAIQTHTDKLRAILLDCKNTQIDIETKKRICQTIDAYSELLEKLTN